MVKEQVLMRKYVNSHLGKSSFTTFINPQLNLQKTPIPTFTKLLENGPTPPPQKKGGGGNYVCDATFTSFKAFW